MSLRSKISPFSSRLSLIVIPLAILSAWLIYQYVLGNPANFENGDRMGQAVENNYLGIVYKGGPLVVLLIGFQLILLTFIFERFGSLRLAKGKTPLAQLLSDIQHHLSSGNLDRLYAACEANKGSVAHVVAEGVKAYERLLGQTAFEHRSKRLQIELENAAQLEVPLLQKNMGILSTLAQISTLIGLLGTVTGMIVAFSALARVGAPDAVGLASGISQALVTTALGISTSALAIVMYNYFNNQIEQITYGIDEAIFTLVQNAQLAKQLQS